MNKNIGNKYKTNQGYTATVIEEIVGINNKYLIEFNDTRKTKTEVWLSHLKKGKVRNPYHKSICEIGYIGENALHPASIDEIPTKCYASWKGMMDRCYKKEILLSRPFYKGCSVIEEWHCYATYSKWFDENYNPEIMEGWHLDKDILVKGNRVYSPKTCAFVPNEINSVVSKKSSRRGKYPVGISETYKNRINKFRARFGGKFIGMFNNIEEAFQAYKEAKEKHIKEIADKWKGQIDDRVYEALYNYKVEITD